MDVRIARLEVDVDYIKRDVIKRDVGELKLDVRTLTDDVSGLRVDFARLDERVRNLPGKGFIVSASMAIIGLITAMIVLGDKLKAVFGLAGG